MAIVAVVMQWWAGYEGCGHLVACKVGAPVSQRNAEATLLRVSKGRHGGKTTPNLSKRWGDAGDSKEGSGIHSLRFERVASMKNHPKSHARGGMTLAAHWSYWGYLE